MTTAEILREIHKEHAEIEVLRYLQEWVLNDRKEWIRSAMENEATVRAIRNIATKTSSPKGALEGIVSLCTED